MADPIADDAKDKTPALLEQLGKFAGLLTFVYAVLFYSGHETLDSYYQRFNIPLWLLDLPAYTYPVSARKLIVCTVLIWLLVRLVLAPFFVWLWRRSARKGYRIPKTIPVTIWDVFDFIALALFLTSVFSYQSGTSKAQTYIQNNSAVTTLVFKSVTPPGPRDEQMLRANQVGALRMLTQTKDLVIVYAMTAKEKLTTYVVARSELASVRTSDIH